MEEHLQLLAQRNKVVGLKQVRRAFKEGSLSQVILASDSDQAILDEVQALCRCLKVELSLFPSKKELGQLVGIEISASVVGILN